MLIKLPDKIDEEHRLAMMNMALGIAVFSAVFCLAPIIMFTVRKMTNEIQIYASEALRKQKVSIYTCTLVLFSVHFPVELYLREGLFTCY